MGKTYTRIGVLFSVVYCVGIGVLVYGRRAQLSGLKLNEIGDFLAGGFGPLAILWLVLGYFQQGIELRINSDALKLQAEELANSVAQQKELVAVAQRQHATDVEALQKEIERHEEERAESRRASLPILRTSVKRIPTNTRGTHFALEVHNAGAPCMDFQLSLDGAPGRPIKRQLSIFQQGTNVRAEFTKPFTTSPQFVEVETRYVSLRGETQVEKGTVSFVSTEEGDMVAIFMKTIELNDV